MSAGIIRARAHAKINLHLGVGEARPDGYHELVTVFQSLDLHDDLSLHVLPDTSAGQGSVVNSLQLSGRSQGVPQDPGNLAWRAVDMLVEAYRATGLPDLPLVNLHLRKGIPVAGGMAGGSADAAAALRVTQAWLGTLTDPLPESELDRIAAQLGSDIPFTLHGGTMLGTGRGENLVPVLSRGDYHWVLAVASRGLSTPEVFARLDQLRADGRDLPASTDTTALNRALLSGDPRELAATLGNDLQAPAISLRPELRAVLAAGATAGALQGIVSGSGPTCAFLCLNADHAADVAEELTDSGIVLTALTATGPAPGARVVPETA